MLRIAQCRFLSSRPKLGNVRNQSSQAAPSKRTVVITGGSSGIGLATAQLFAREGWNVHNISRSPCPVPGTTNHRCDLTIRQDVRETAYRVAECVGGAHGDKKPTIAVVHNASLHLEDSSAAFVPEAFQDSFEMAVIAPGIITDPLLDCMAPGSSVLFVGSTLSEQAVASCASYVTVKHAVIGLMRAYTQDLFGTGIHTACICPGFTDTPMLRNRPLMQSDEGDKFIRSKVSLGRLIESEEIAKLIKVAADSPAFNGAVLHCHGGQRQT